MESSSLWLIIICIGHNIYDSSSPFSLLPSQFWSFSITVEYNYVCGVVIATLLKSFVYNRNTTQRRRMSRWCLPAAVLVAFSKTLGPRCCFLCSHFPCWVSEMVVWVCEGDALVTPLTDQWVAWGFLMSHFQITSDRLEPQPSAY